MIVSVRAPQLPGPSSVPSRRIVVHGFGDGGLRVREDARVGARAARPRPDRAARRAPTPRRPSAPTPAAGRHDVREQDGAAVAGRPARLLVGEDALEHVVAPHRDPGGGDVRRGGQGDEYGDEQRHRSATASTTANTRNASKARSAARIAVTIDRSMPESASSETHDARSEAADHDAERDAEQHEPAPRGPPIQLADARHEQRQEPGDEHRLSVCGLLTRSRWLLWLGALAAVRGRRSRWSRSPSRGRASRLPALLLRGAAR